MQVWETEAWKAEVEGWIVQQVRPSGPPEPIYSSITSRLWRIPTDSGPLIFKAVAPIFHYEIALTERLALWFPGNVPGVIAADVGRGWLLMHDVGPTLRTCTKADGDFSRWDDALRQFARFQQASAARTADLLALGAHDYRLERLPSLYNDLIADHAALLLDQPNGVSAADMERLQAYRPQVAALCQQLRAYGLPATLHHDDFHDNNIAGEYVFFDWAESAVGHPFSSMMIALRVVKWLHKQDTPLLDHLRDVYLAEWQDYGLLPRLREAFALTQQIAALCRALTWRSILMNVDLPPEDRADYLDSPPYWTLLFLDFATSPEV